MNGSDPTKPQHPFTDSPHESGPKTIPRKPKQDRPATDDPGVWRMGRRSLLQAAGWASIVAFSGVSLYGIVRFLFPRVLFEPAQVFTAGKPDEYIAGEVSERFLRSQHVWIVRDSQGLYAILAVCTHLGCTPRWLPEENKFKCPCHGSGYFKSGINFEGPAPRPMERLKITLDDNGEIVVDKSVRFRYETGGWGKPEAFLTYPV